jgi:transposase
VRRYSKTAFVAAASVQIAGRKVDKARWLADFYDTASTSLGLPVSEASEAMRMFRIVLEEYRALCLLRKRLEADVVTRLAHQPDFIRLQTLPGIGPILAMIILAEARDLRRWLCAAVSQILRLRSVHRAVGPISWDHAPVKTGQRAAPVRLLDGGDGRDPDAAKQFSPEV